MKNWVKVSDSLPSIGQLVLVFHPWGKDEKYKDVLVAKINSITSYETSKNVEWVNAEFSPVEPTHWMPLPEPPKE